MKTETLAESLLKGYKILESEEQELEKDTPKEEDLEVEDEIDTDDAQLLAVVNNYFKKINAKSPNVKADKLEKLVHRLINSMIEMPRGEKEARIALKLAIKEINN